MLDVENLKSDILFKIEKISDLKNNNIHSKEQEILNSFKSEKRKEEFIASRVITKELFKEFDIMDFPLLRDSNNAPIWGNKIKGSISHSKDFCAVMITNDPIIKSVGIDLECFERDNNKYKNKIFNQDENKIIESNLGKIDYHLIAFSGKESIYKAFYQLNESKLKSTEVILEKINSDFLEFRINSKRTNVYYKINDQYLLTYCIIL